MSKWLVRVRETRVWTAEVEAPSWSEAADVANLTEPVDVQFDRTSDPLRQLDEPWVSGHWYDVNCDDILVCERSYGNLFSEAEVATLHRRIESFGLTVTNSWNGAGCTTVSFSCVGRHGTEAMTEAQLATLLAPMEEPAT